MRSSDLTAGPRGRVIEDIYPLTALQQGLLLHTRLAVERGMYWTQTGLVLEGELDGGVLRRAWELVFARHAVLRSTVVWERMREPLSVVSRSVPLPWREVDLSGLAGAGQRRAVEEFLARDRAAGADFGAPSLVRLALLRLGRGRHQLVWSLHHLVMDGWSLPIVLGEVLEAYRALRAGVRPPDRAHRPFRDFVAWLAGRDPGEAAGYWRERLAGVGAPTVLGIERATGRAGQREQHVRLAGEVAAGLGEFARRRRLTVNTVVQGAWAVLMGVYSGSDDVVFGVTSSGRGGQVEGMESMVGLLINTTPARVRVDRDRPVAQWLAGLQEEQVRARQFEHTPLVAIQACSDIPAGQQLFTTLFAFENYPVEALREEQARAEVDGLRVEWNLFRQRDELGLVLAAGTERSALATLAYDRARFDDDVIGRMAGHLGVLLTAIADDADVPLSGLPVLTAGERQQLVAGWNDTAAPVPAVGRGA